MYENIKIARDLEELLNSRSEITNAQVVEVLKGGNQNHVCIVEIDGTQVVVKRFLGDGAAETVSSLQAELRFVAGIMKTGRNRINECVFAFPEQGLVGLSFVPGRRLGAVLSETRGEERGALMEHAGEWLGQYTASRRRVGSFAPIHWLGRLSKLGECRPEDGALLAGLRKSLESQAPRIQGCQVTHAATHGDYVGLNAHYHEGVIYGVDVQGESWLPLARDITGFLVWEGLRSRPAPEDMWLGLRRQDSERFLVGVDLPSVEHNSVLPFMIGVQLYKRIIERSNNLKKLDRLSHAVENYISTAACLPET